MAQECWEQESLPSSHSPRLRRSRERAGARGLHPPRKDQPSAEPPHRLAFPGELAACWALIKEPLITSRSLLRALIPDREPACKLQGTGCHRHREGSGWFSPVRLRPGTEGFSSLKRENVRAGSLARLKLAAKLSHVGSFFIPRPQILCASLTIALQCRRTSGLSLRCFSAARRCMLFLRK